MDQSELTIKYEYKLVFLSAPEHKSDKLKGNYYGIEESVPYNTRMKRIYHIPMPLTIKKAIEYLHNFVELKREMQKIILEEELKRYFEPISDDLSRLVSPLSGKKDGGADQEIDRGHGADECDAE